MNGYVAIVRHQNKIHYHGQSGSPAEFQRLIRRRGAMAARGVSTPFEFDTLGFVLSNQPERLQRDLCAEWGDDLTLEQVDGLLALISVDYPEVIHGR